MNDLVFSLDLMCRLGKKLPRRLLPHDISDAICSRQLVCGVGLSESKLRDVRLAIELWTGGADLLHIDWERYSRDIMSYIT